MLRLARLALVLFLAVPGSQAAAQAENLDAIARDYVRLQLEIGARDEGYVDAYYGPAEIRAEATANPRSVEELQSAVGALQRRLNAIAAPGIAAGRFSPPS
jgi:hypothetical protein